MIEFLMQPQTLYYVLTFIFGGGLFSLIKTFVESKQINANAKGINLKSPLEAENLQISGMESLIKNLQDDNKVLRDDRDYWKGNYEMVREQVEKLSAELDRQEERNAKLRAEIDKMKARLDEAEKRSPAHVAGRDDLEDKYPHEIFPNH